jgi:hypothetical protein
MVLDASPTAAAGPRLYDGLLRSIGHPVLIRTPLIGLTAACAACHRAGSAFAHPLCALPRKPIDDIVAAPSSIGFQAIRLTLSQQKHNHVNLI